MKCSALLLCLFSFSVFAEVSPEHVSQMLDQMVRESVVSKEEADKARARMKSMSPSQWGEINQKAQGIAERSPASVVPSNNRIEEVQAVDLDGAQFKQIQDDMKKIVPQYHD